jgi:2-phospho-L-lactate/phosphoenolpyruvate guanylyltransferase
VDPTYAVVVPVKPPTIGKSRLQGPTDRERRQLAEAFALDTVAACLETAAVAQVLVATDDAAFSTRFATLGCATVPDGDTTDLNAALRQAAAEARRRWPDLCPVALCADLPALRPDDLAAALHSVDGASPAFVADAAGSGTTLYLAPYDEFDPRFGVDSRRAHAESGALEIAGDLPTLRHDVDDLDDLRAALVIGVGAETRRLAATLSAS